MIQIENLRNVSNEQQYTFSVIDLKLFKYASQFFFLNLCAKPKIKIIIKLKSKKKIFF